MPVAAFKVGVLGSVENVVAVAEIVADYPDIPLVLDPVLAARLGLAIGDGFRLGAQDFVLMAALTREPDAVGGTFGLGPRTLVATQGLAQGSLDATLMPVLRSHIDERYSATGYGLLNLTSAGVGALISFFGGWFKDQGVPLTTTLAAAGCLMLFCGLLLLMLPRPKH